MRFSKAAVGIALSAVTCSAFLPASRPSFSVPILGKDRAVAAPRFMSTVDAEKETYEFTVRNIKRRQRLASVASETTKLLTCVLLERCWASDGLDHQLPLQ